MPLMLRYMHADDVSQVTELDALSFPDPWPMRSYMFEINESKISHMCCLVDVDAVREAPSQSWMDWLRRRKPVLAPTDMIVAYGGLWCIAEEAHISTIAANPRYRGRGYGEITLVGMLLRAEMLRAEYVVLEVRVSNHIAQKMYAKYGFVTVDVNRKYYRDGEDAFVMRLDLNQPGVMEHIHQLYDKVKARVPFEDLYSRVIHPRLGE